MNRNTSIKNRTRASLKRKRNNVNKTVRYLRGKPTVSRTSIRKATGFQKELETIPIYIINGHACLCGLEEKCMGEKAEPFFEIPADTYLLTYGEAGDYSCFGESMVDHFMRSSEDIRDYLTVHSSSDMRNLPESKYSMFGDMNRAAQTIEKGADKITYPNLNYGFNPDKGEDPKENKYGVYRIDQPGSPLSSLTINNKLSVIPQNAKRKNWFLADIIQEVYKKTGIKKGIFLNTGCLTSCSRENPTGPHMDKAASLISFANAMYPTVRETLTYREMMERSMYVPHNSGVNYKISRIHPKIAKEYVNKGLFSAEDLLKNRNLWADEEDMKLFREFTMKNKRNNKK